MNLGYTWTFKPINVDKIYCKKCVLRWTWDAHHISKSSPEKYENCIDVTINGPSGVDSANQQDSSSKPSEPVAILPQSTAAKSKIPPVATVNKKVDHFTKSKEHQPPSNPVSDSANQKPSINSSGNTNDCKCNLSTDVPIYTQCTPDGNYCTCFTGAWSALGKQKSNCAPGTSCKQNGLHIMCV